MLNVDLLSSNFYIHLLATHLNVRIHAGPPDGVRFTKENEGPGHHRDVLEDLLLDLGQSGHVSEVALILARHPPCRIKVRDLTADEVSEHTNWFVGLVVFLEDGLVGVGYSVSHQHDGLVGLCPYLKQESIISRSPASCDFVKSV